MTSMNSNDFKSWLSKLPKWLRIAVIVLMAIVGVLSFIFTTESCSTIRISQSSNGEVRVSSNQSTLDSTKIEINLLNNKK